MSYLKVGLSAEFPLLKLTLLSSLDLLPDDASLRSMLLCSLLFSDGSTECYFLLANGGLPISETSFLSLKKAESPCSH